MGILDGHVHLIGEAADDYLAALLRGMDRNAVERAVVFGVQGDSECPDSLATSAHEQHPDRFTPFTSELDPKATDLAETVDRRLSQGPWRGVGEIFLAAREPTASYTTRDGRQMQYRYPVPSDGPLTHRWGELFDVCARHGVPVLIHYDIACPGDEKALGVLLARYPRTTFIWAHVDWSASTAAQLLQAHSNLLCELGAALHFAALDEAHASHVADWLATWGPLLERFAGRITFGSDHFEWRHLEPDENADTAYQAMRRACDRLPSHATTAWRGGALREVLETP